MISFRDLEMFRNEPRILLVNHFNVANFPLMLFSWLLILVNKTRLFFVLGEHHLRNEKTTDHISNSSVVTGMRSISLNLAQLGSVGTLKPSKRFFGKTAA